MPVVSVESPALSLGLGPQFILTTWNLSTKATKGFLLPFFLGLSS